MRGAPRLPADNPGANLKSISHICHPILVAFVWELTKETIDLPLGCLQGGSCSAGSRTCRTTCAASPSPNDATRLGPRARGRARRWGTRPSAPCRPNYAGAVPRIVGAPPPRIASAPPPRIASAPPPRIVGAPPPRIADAAPLIAAPPRIAGAAPPRIARGRIADAPPRIAGAPPPQFATPPTLVGRTGVVGAPGRADAKRR